MTVCYELVCKTMLTITLFLNIKRVVRGIMDQAETTRS
jgi:hypothetical protein